MFFSRSCRMYFRPSLGSWTPSFQMGWLKDHFWLGQLCDWLVSYLMFFTHVAQREREGSERGSERERERGRERERERCILFIYIYIFIYLFIHSHKLTTPLTMFYKEVTSAGPQWGPGSYPVHRPEHLRSRSTSRSGAGTGGREVVPGWCSAPLFTCLTVYPLVNKQVAIENGPSIVDLPIKNGDFP